MKRSLSKAALYWILAGVAAAVFFALQSQWIQLGMVAVTMAIVLPALLLPAKKQQKHIFTVLAVAALVVVLPVPALIYLLLSKGIGAISWSFLTQAPVNIMREGGIFPAIVGTIYLILGTTLFALPLGVMAAVYLSEYARPNLLTRLIRLSIVNLAGVPSVVYGLFGLGLFVIIMKMGASLLAGSLTLAVLTLPVIITASEEALSSVPQSFRNASLALGATKWQTTVRVVFPNAIPGIITGLILGVGRAAGETAPILFTVAAFYLRDLPKSVYDQAMALPYHLFVMSTQVPNAPVKMQWGTALVLLALVLSTNLVASIIRSRYRRARRW